MVPIRGEWTPFVSENDQIEHYRLWGLIPPKSKKLRPVMVVDGYLGSPEPCSVVGDQGDKWAVIQLDDGMHAVHGEALAEMQPSAQQYLPRGTCFVEILSDYVVFDIETTGLSRQNDSIIEIAAIRYQYGKAIAQFSSLVNPNKPLSSRVKRLTGITQDDVDSAPTIDEVANDFLDFIGALPIIGHNAASFDVPFLAAQLETEITNPVVDTLTMARKVFDLLPSHKLEFLNNVLQLDATSSHRAFADVETTNKLLWACLAPRRYEQNVHNAFLDNKLSCNATPVSRPQKKLSIHDVKPSSPPLPGPLLGKSVVFTGELSIPRDNAFQLAIDAGAVIKSGVSVKTDYLVVGQQSQSHVGEDGISAKEKRADEINRSGKAHVEIIDEKVFFSLLQRDGVDG